MKKHSVGLREAWQPMRFDHLRTGLPIETIAMIPCDLSALSFTRQLPMEKFISTPVRLPEIGLYFGYEKMAPLSGSLSSCKQQVHGARNDSGVAGRTVIDGDLLRERGL
ncbi:MAG: hypothetical protein QX199_19480 [Methylococcaceae bacterium]